MANAITNKNKPSQSDENTGRKWIYPQIIKGKLYKYRTWFSYLLILLMFSGPFIKINGEQLILFNIIERKFVFFGVIFWPQDFYLFVLAMLTFIVFILLFTVVFGRVWCGWACPQTIFMEMLFRKIENWIEGDWNRQKKLNAAPWSFEKVWKKGSKHFIFALISCFIANIFLAYIIGTEELLKIINEPLSQHVTGFLSIVIFTIAFYMVFAYMREIVCTVICPYGRLQGVLLDNKSMVVAYDYERGEPRGKINRHVTDEYAGDCIDCNICVQVCPTGIDIRQGTQMECVNCTACIDACDMVMEKINRPPRLIGFKSEEQITTRTPFTFGQRVYGYSAILLITVSVLTVLIIRRSDIDATILRAAGTLYQEHPNGTVSNLYNAELINKTSYPVKIELEPVEAGTKIQYIQKQDSLQKGGSAKLTFFIYRAEKMVSQYKSEIEINIVSNGKVLDKVKTTFIAPPNL